MISYNLLLPFNKSLIGDLFWKKWMILYLFGFRLSAPPERLTKQRKYKEKLEEFYQPNLRAVIKPSV